MKKLASRASIVAIAIGWAVILAGCTSTNTAPTVTDTSSDVPAPAYTPEVPQVTSAAPVAPAPTSAAPAPTSAAPAPTSAAPADDFAIGTPYSGNCTYAAAMAPVVTSTTVQISMSCTGVPSKYLFALVVYGDPTFNVPYSGSMRVTGVVQDFATSQAGMTVPVIQASSIAIS